MKIIQSSILKFNVLHFAQTLISFWAVVGILMLSWQSIWHRTSKCQTVFTYCSAKLCSLIAVPNCVHLLQNEKVQRFFAHV